MSNITGPVLPSIDFTSRDYEALRADMIRLIRVRIPQWSADNPSDFGVAMVEAYAYGLDIIHYYLDRIANEAYLSTAVQRESLYSIAEMFNYTPRASEAATVDLEFSNATTTQVVLPAGTRCQASVSATTGVIIKNFETTVDTIIPATTGITSSAAIVPATEGRTYKDETIGVSTGFVAQQYLLPRTSVLPNTTTISTQLGDVSTDWYETSNLATASPSDRSYQVVRMTDGSSMVRFGNNLNGAVPELHAIIKATYRVGGGTDGNVSPYTVTAIIEPVLYGISVTNPSSASGGVNAESLDSIRINAARSFRARDRAVTLSDFNSVAESAPGIAKAKSVGNNGSSVTVYVVPDDSLLDRKPEPTQELLDSTRAYLEQRSMAGVSVSVFGPRYTTFYVKVSGYLFPAAYQELVRKDIERRLLDLYSFQNVGFDGKILSQDISTALLGIDGVQYIEVEAISLSPAFTVSAGVSPTATILMNEVSVDAVQYWDEELSLTIALNGGIA